MRPNSELGPLFSVSMFCPYDKVVLNRPYMHPTYELYYQLSGHTEFLVEDCAYYLTHGSLVMFDAFTKHVYVNASSDSQAYMILLPSELVEKITKQLSIVSMDVLFKHTNIVLNARENQSKFRDAIFKSISEEYSCQPEHYEKRIQFLLGDLMIHIVRNLNYLDIIEKRSKKNEMLYEIAAYLSNFYDESITLDFLSKKFHVEKTYLCSVFKKTFGVTILDYLSIIRIKKACMLLIGTDDRITDIAYATGFKTLASFERTFKKYIKYSPMRFRKMSIEQIT